MVNSDAATYIVVGLFLSIFLWLMVFAVVYLIWL